MEERLLELSEKGNIKVRIETYSDGAFLLNDIRRGVEFDLLYLDIEMEQLDGLSLAREFRKDHPNAVLIYISNHESYLKELFEVDTFRFLSKPIDSEKFEAYFRNAVEKIQLQQEELFFSYSYDRQFFKVLLSDIVYFESQKRSIRLYKKDGTEGSFYGKLKTPPKTKLRRKRKTPRKTTLRQKRKTPRKHRLPASPRRKSLNWLPRGSVRKVPPLKAAIPIRNII